MWKYGIVTVVLVVLCAVVLTAPAHADGWTDKLGATVCAAFNDGPVLGGGLNYQVYDYLWVEAGAKAAENKINPYLGASTDLAIATTLLSTLLKLDIPNVPDNSRIMGAYGFGNAEWFFAVAQGIDF